ncbi:hypothetical protein EON80_10990 [bacterium]|nr:MAG: hypothetical protein EON80_10990 [bacterium]
MDINWVCYLKVEFRESEWVYSLEVSGVRSKRYQERRDEIAHALLAEITNWVASKSALPDMAPKKPCRAHAYFDLTRDDGIAELSEPD